MAKYVFIESTDPFDVPDIGRIYDVTVWLARSGNAVTVLLIDQAVLAARAGQHTFWFAELQRAGVEVRADATSLRRHAVSPHALAPGVRPSEETVESVLNGRQRLWITDQQPSEAA
jgi:intracellular sulfur oxidation DsrE/DsrF family protein